jgi:hypothetical protein
MELRTPRAERRQRLLASAAVCVALGCSDDARFVGVAAPEAAEPGGERLYAVSSNVFSQDDVTGYLALVSSLDESTTVDLDTAIEFPGGANATGFGSEPAVYVGSWSAPTIERWDLDAAGALQRGDSVSFAHLGVQETSSVAFTRITTREKSYFADAEGRQLVSWNPTAMTALGSVPLPLANEGTLAPGLMIYLAVQQDHVLVNSFMADPDDWTRLSDRSRLLAVDMRRDEVVSVDESIGCEKVELAGQTSDGTAYYTSDTSRSFARRYLGAGFGTTPCGLRVVPPGVGFDQGFDVDLTSLVGGRAVVGDVAVVSDRMAFLRVWHEEDVTEAVTAENFFDIYSTTRGFRWWRWEIGTDAAQEIPGQTPHGGFANKLEVDGRTFVVDTSLVPEDGGRGPAPLIELLPSGELGRGLTARGQVRQVIRLR